MVCLAAFGLLGVAAVALLLFTPLGTRPLAALFPLSEPTPVDFATLRLTARPNQHLVCPPGRCVGAHEESPVFDMPVGELRDRWRAMAAGRPRVRLLAETEDGLQADYVQRSARFRFPDIITVRFIPLAAEQSTLAVYSRSLYGHSDLGVNRARVESWLAELAAEG